MHALPDSIRSIWGGELLAYQADVDVPECESACNKGSGSHVRPIDAVMDRRPR